MKNTFKDHFSQISKSYRDFRPEYPVQLFQWLAQISPRRETALDCGCGTGQAAVALANYFGKVYAVDPSSEQIANANHHEKVTYLVVPAEVTGLPHESQDLIIAAQSLHWFDLDRFYPEVQRLATIDAVFAAITYGLISVNENVDAVLQHLYHDILGSYWPPERLHVDNGYRTLPFPFPKIASPKFEMTACWRLVNLFGYLSTWSAVKEFKVQTGNDPLEMIDIQLREAWNGPDNIKYISWPLVIMAGKIN